MFPSARAEHMHMITMGTNSHDTIPSTHELSATPPVGEKKVKKSEGTPSVARMTLHVEMRNRSGKESSCVMEKLEAKASRARGSATRASQPCSMSPQPGVS